MAEYYSLNFMLKCQRFRLVYSNSLKEPVTALTVLFKKLLNEQAQAIRFGSHYNSNGHGIALVRSIGIG